MEIQIIEDVPASALAQLLIDCKADDLSTEVILQSNGLFTVKAWRESSVGTNNQADAPDAPRTTEEASIDIQPSEDPTFAERLVNAAITEWDFFGRQAYDIAGNATHTGHKEGEKGFAERIGTYWLEGTKTHGIDGTKNVPWSAAFISWLMRKAGAGDQFRYSTQHSIFISQAIRDQNNGRIDAGFWGWRLNEYRPSIGDLICFARESGVDYQHQNGGDYKGHTDVVVEVGNGVIWVIGGNVGNSVTKRPIAVDVSGFLTQQSISGELLFAIMENRIPHPSDRGGLDVPADRSKADRPMTNKSVGLQGPRIAWGQAVSPAFKAKVIEIAKALGCDPSHLMAAMAFETGETFSASKRSKVSGATGLIQFMPATAAALGTTVDALSKMSEEEQLDFVLKYFMPKKGRLSSLSDVYMAILWPKAVGKPDATAIFASPSIQYTQNRGLDRNRDGVVTKGEATSFVQIALEKGLSSNWIG